MRRTLLTLILLPACRSTEPPALLPPPPPPVASASPAAPPSSTPTPVASTLPANAGPPCGKLLDANRALLPDDHAAWPSSEADLGDACYPTPNGAWALRLTEWQPDGEWAGIQAFKGTVEVVHFHARREALVAERATARTRFALRTGVNHTHLHKPQLVDLDQDGEPELFLVTDEKEHEGPFTRNAHLLSWKRAASTSSQDDAGSLALYPGVPDNVEEMTDIDSDGRMDLVYYPYAEERSAPCSGFGYTWRGPAFLAHGRPDGSFVTDDAAARAFLKRACPVRKSAKADESDTPVELCARLAGKSGQAALAVLKGTCRAPRGNEACQTPPGVCADYEERAKVIGKKPPLLLGP